MIQNYTIFYTSLYRVFFYLKESNIVLNGHSHLGLDLLKNHTVHLHVKTKGFLNQVNINFSRLCFFIYSIVWVFIS